MQKINIVCVGKLKEQYLREACDEYLKRLSRFAKTEVIEIPECKTLKEEGARILRRASGKIFALCVEGAKCSSEGFADKIKLATDKGEEITFIIGSSCGLSDEVKRAADERISFSDLTFAHRMMRVILLEQVYRAFMIIGGSEYHK